MSSGIGGGGAGGRGGSTEGRYWGGGWGSTEGRYGGGRDCIQILNTNFESI